MYKELLSSSTPSINILIFAPFKFMTISNYKQDVMLSPVNVSDLATSK